MFCIVRVNVISWTSFTSPTVALNLNFFLNPLKPLSKFGAGNTLSIETSFSSLFLFNYSQRHQTFITFIFIWASRPSATNLPHTHASNYSLLIYTNFLSINNTSKQFIYCILAYFNVYFYKLINIISKHIKKRNKNSCIETRTVNCQHKLKKPTDLLTLSSGQLECYQVLWMHTVWEALLRLAVILKQHYNSPVINGAHLFKHNWIGLNRNAKGFLSTS